MPYIAVKWELETQKTPKRSGHAIIETPREFLNLVESSAFIFDEIPIQFLEQKISQYTRRRDIKNREYKRYRKNSTGEKLYIQRQDLKKQPFIAIHLPVFWRKKHIQTFFSSFKFKHWTKITWKNGKEIVPANHGNVILVMPTNIPQDSILAKVIL